LARHRGRKTCQNELSGEEAHVDEQVNERKVVAPHRMRKHDREEKPEPASKRVADEYERSRGPES
jgi:hypothetical protein